MIKEIIKDVKNVTVICKNNKDLEKVYNLLIKNGVKDNEILNYTEEKNNKLPHFDISKKYAKLLVNEISKKVPLFLCK